MAVAVGFEPTVRLPHTRFRGALLWPLGHATAKEGTRWIVRTASGVSRFHGRPTMIRRIARRIGDSNPEGY